jgi:hypothetical protein
MSNKPTSDSEAGNLGIRVRTAHLLRKLGCLRETPGSATPSRDGCAVYRERASHALVLGIDCPRYRPRRQESHQAVTRMDVCRAPRPSSWTDVGGSPAGGKPEEASQTGKRAGLGACPAPDVRA